MPTKTRKSFVKPDKSKLLVKMGRKEEPQNAEEILASLKEPEKIGTSRFYPKKHPPVIEEPEILDDEGMAQKKAIISLLTKIVIPNPLSARSTPEADKRSFVLKLSKSTLKQLRGFIPDRIKRMPAEKLNELISDIDMVREDEKVEIQSLYMDISP